MLARRNKEIRTPKVVWALGDPEQSTQSGVTTVMRPLWYYPADTVQQVRVGDINPDHADKLMRVLNKVKATS